MGTIFGVVVGYVLGTRAGEDGWAELREAWNVVTGSSEVKDMTFAGLTLAREMLARGSELLAAALSHPDDGADLRRAV